MSTDESEPVECPDILQIDTSDSDDSDADDASQEDGSSTVGRDGNFVIALCEWYTRSDVNIGCHTFSTIHGFDIADYIRMATINAEAPPHKRAYTFGKRKEASQKQSRSFEKLSSSSIRKALHTRCNDSHNCIEEFSEADVTAVRK